MSPVHRPVRRSATRQAPAAARLVRVALVVPVALAVLSGCSSTPAKTAAATTSSPSAAAGTPRPAARRGPGSRRPPPR